LVIRGRGARWKRANIDLSLQSLLRDQIVLVDGRYTLAAVQE